MTTTPLSHHQLLSGLVGAEEEALCTLREHIHGHSVALVGFKSEWDCKSCLGRVWQDTSAQMSRLF